MNLKYFLPHFRAESDRLLQSGLEERGDAASLADADSVGRLFADKMGIAAEMEREDLAGARRFAEEGSELLASLYGWVVAIQVFAVLFGMVATVTIARLISRPLAGAIVVANGVAEGDLTQPIEVETRDETGQLMRALRNMRNLLKQAIRRLQRAATNATATATQMSTAIRQQEQTVSWPIWTA